MIIYTISFFFHIYLPIRYLSPAGMGDHYEEREKTLIVIF